MTNTADTTSGTIQFFQNHQTPLNAGIYKVKVSQKVTIKGTNTADSPFTAAKEFVVSGNPFTLMPQDIHSIFPPEGSLGDHAHILPYILLRRSTLPWEQLAQAGEENAPWLALIVIYEEEQQQGNPPPVLPLQTLSLKQLQSSINGIDLTIGNLKQQAQGQILPSQLSQRKDDEKIGKIFFPGINLTDDGFPLVTGHQTSDLVTVLDIKKRLLQSLLPTINDLKYLAHVRQVQSSEGRSVLATVMANRLPNSTQLPNSKGKSTAYLLSLEGRYSNGTFNFQGATDEDYLRLIVLKSWSFTCADPARSFLGLLKSLDRTGNALLRLPPVNDATAEKFLGKGYVPLPHFLRRGGNTISWYHSPLIPGENHSAIALSQMSVRSADQLIQYDKNYGVFDASYAAAWQLGQLLALQDRLFAVSLFNWKRANALKLAKANQQSFYPHLFPADQSVDTDNLKFPEEIANWFQRLGLLYGVPFNYLVPDERMLPAESIRFFHLDWFWVESLLDGAFSIGRVQESQVQPSPITIQQQKMTGFLLRSQIVAGWTDLQIDACATVKTGNNNISDSEKLKKLRCDRLSDNVLLVLFQGEVQTLDIYLKPEGLQFAFNRDQYNNFWRELRDLQGIEKNDWKVQPIPWKETSKRVVNIDQLAVSMKTELDRRSVPIGEFNSAEFALQMLTGTPTMRFTKSWGAPATITSFSPSSGAVGRVVAIAGTNLSTTWDVKFNGIAASFTIDSNTQVSAIIPPNATSGKISVTTSEGTVTTSSNLIILPPEPSISSFSPTSGVVGNNIVITGTNLSTTTDVRINGVVASFVVNSNSQVSVTIPPNATSGKISVNTSGGQVTTATDLIVVPPAPTVSSFSPSSGVAGTVVVITGANLSTTINVRINGVVASFVVNSNSQVSVTIPPNATTGRISLATSGGTVTTSSNLTIIPPPPTISSFSPTSGYVGNSVVITGTNLLTTSMVRFNGVVANFMVISNSQVNANVPPSATTGRISLTTSGGTVTSASNFTILSSPYGYGTTQGIGGSLL